MLEAVIRMATNPMYFMQNSFSGGELSPVMDARQDLAKYASGLKKMKNFYPLAHGAAVNRPGTKFIAETKYSNKKSRLIPFQFSSSQTYNIEFGDLYCRFYKNGEQIKISGSPYEVVTPYLEADIANIKFAQSADVLYLTHPNYAPRLLSRYADANWTLTEFSSHNGPFSTLNLIDTLKITPSATTGNITVATNASVFNSLEVGSLMKIEHDVESNSLTATLSSALPSGSIRGLGTWDLIVHGTWTGTLCVEKSEDNGTTWTKMRTYNSADDYDPIASGTETEKLILLRVNMISYTSGSCRFTLSWQPFTSHGIVKLTAVTSSTSANATVLTELGSTNATNLFYHGAWSEYAGYPCSVVFFQNRLVFGGTKKQPQTLWWSQSGDYTNFGISSPIVDSDSITTPLVAEQVNAIQNLKSLDKIIGFTSGGNWKIGGSGNNDAVTPTSQSAVQQGYYGSSNLTPLSIGNRIIYSEAKGSSVRDIGYDYTSDSYTGNELTILAEHLFRNRSITEWAYAQEPNGIIWCVCDDGSCLGFTYLKEQDVWGWSIHETDGLFESVSSISGNDIDEVSFIVNRTINGSTKRYVEQLAPRDPKVYYATDSDGEQYSYIKSEESYFVDCGISYSGAATSVITGLNHLEGKTVSILANGNVHPQIVVTGGSVSLDFPVTVCHVGLPYVSDIQTLNVDFALQNGTLQTRFKRITECTLRMENSRNAFVGISFKKLFELKVRKNENWDEPVRVFSGDISVNLASASNRQGSVCLRMKDPLPITLLALVSLVTVDG
jgi:hypothetical protein